MPGLSRKKITRLRANCWLLWQELSSQVLISDEYECVNSLVYLYSRSQFSRDAFSLRIISRRYKRNIQDIQQGKKQPTALQARMKDILGAESLPDDKEGLRRIVQQALQTFDCFPGSPDDWWTYDNRPMARSNLEFIDFAYDGRRIDFIDCIAVRGPAYVIGSDDIPIISFAKLICRVHPCYVLAVISPEDFIFPYWESRERYGVFFSVKDSDDEATEDIMRRYSVKAPDEDDETAFNFGYIETIDGDGIWLDSNGIKLLLNAFRSCSPDSPLLVHCKCGVGRTGTICYLKALWDEFSKGEKFGKVIEKMLKGSKISTGDLIYLSVQQVKILDQLRKERFLVQTKQQLFSILPQFLLLCAHSMELPSERMRQLEIMGIDLFNSAFAEFPQYTPVKVLDRASHQLVESPASDRLTFRDIFELTLSPTPHDGITSGCCHCSLFCRKRHVEKSDSSERAGYNELRELNPEEDNYIIRKGL